MSSSATLQHYVPRFLLRRFGVGKKDHVWVYDKRADRAFQASTKRVAAEHGLYDFEFQGVPMTYEPGLAGLETKAAAVTKRVVEAKSLGALTSDDQVLLAAFLAVQLVRTKATQAQFRHLGTLLADLLRDSAGDDPEAMAHVEAYIGSNSEAERRLSFAGILHHSIRDFSPLLLEKKWVLAETIRRHPFLIGDHPVAMNNRVDHWPRGSLGLAVRGIEVYMPLSPELQLCLYCPTLIKELEAAREHALSHVRRSGSARAAISHAEVMLDCFATGRPHAAAPENVDYCNSLQILHAERYVIASKPDFEMARDMIRDDAGVRQGRRGTVAS